MEGLEPFLMFDFQSREESDRPERTASVPGHRREHLGEVNSSCHSAMLVPGRVLSKTDDICGMLNSVRFNRLESRIWPQVRWTKH